MRNEDVFNNNSCECGCTEDANGVVSHVEDCHCEEKHHFEEDKKENCCGEEHEHGDSCGCGHDHEELGFYDEELEVDLEPIYITFEGDDGESFELECGVIGIFETEENDYIAVLIPEVENEFEEGVYYFRYTEDEEGNQLLDEIESDEEFEKVHEVFEDIYTVE